MKKSWIIVLVVLVILVAGYLGRHKIRQMIMPAPTPAPVVATVSPTAAMTPSDNIYKMGTDSKGANYLTDFAGKTLYVFDKDTAGVSNCEGQCLVNWPVYTSGATAQKTFPENITVIKRTDGTMQFAWKGMPLYYFAKDLKAGDTLGDGVGGTWHLVRPTPKSS